MHSRRDFTRLLFATAGIAATGGLAGPAGAVESTVRGVKLGVCLYDFRDTPRTADHSAYIDKMIQACVDTGGRYVEINSPYLEPVTNLPFQGLPGPNEPWPAPPTTGAVPMWLQMPREAVMKQREDLRAWRINTPLSFFQDIRQRFVRAGLEPYSYVVTFTWDMTDQEIDAIFRQAQALGVDVFSTNQTKVSVAPRLAPFAERYRMDLGFHNHTKVDDPNEVASVGSFERLFAMSPRFKANLDVGHFVAANQDPIAFLEKHHARTTHLHMKDRKRNEGPQTPWGEGDAPLKEILHLVRDRRWPIPCLVEYEYRGAGTGAQETAKCMQFMREALA